MINNDTYQRETLSERPIRNPLKYLTSYLGTFDISQGTNYFFSENPHSVEQFTAIFAKISANLYNFFNPVKLEYLPLIFKVTKRQKHMLHLKSYYIFGILESRWMNWHIYKWYSSTLSYMPNTWFQSVTVDRFLTSYSAHILIKFWRIFQTNSIVGLATNTCSY